jgi:ribosomal protein S18 acetylase RimI-like enzyme
MVIVLRKLIRNDRSSIENFLSRISVFDDKDVALALELLDTDLDHPSQKDYIHWVATNDSDQAIGFVCYGPTPLTEGTNSLYWIAVDPDYAGQGIGTLLLQNVENRLRDENARLLILETSSGQDYTLSRQFYLKNGYQIAEIIKDFYREGEDRVTFLKILRG